MLFGQSAGAIDTFAISTLEEAPSLISAIISESGGGRDSQTYQQAQSLGAQFAAAINCSVTDVR